VEPKIESLSAYNRIAYARKHFSPAHRILYSGAVFLRYLLRSVCGGRGDLGRGRRQASRAALSTLLGRSPVPYGPPSRFSVRPWGRPHGRATVADLTHAGQVDE
jgi:hypothetical protein